ncbi:type I-E CRISPR-associated endoribonuclease Cas2e [Lactobacillus xylocopicola]|uniref:Type I-E CRISPR-associated endoribonuclease Cas2 n=1 Tax=Lactobacillus xylocopicola TaxID=2976676 RepID=A0ABN6SK58_9LACO|nr:type I-E CRISPR-associated endoribonuclease Cas2e [Lactobacillus xylocopicola]BDR60574.1 type I-E CRISPR-associated endoribonuclease Cas2 [Lactobacillus xylocopicola]
MIVITLTKVPPSLRGDLTKWCQEIQTGVYVGNVTARIRDLLWDRIMRDIGNGQATMAFNAKNEFGYQVKTTRPDYQVRDFEGIPLVKRLNRVDVPVKHGFSKAAKWRKAKAGMQKHYSIESQDRFVTLDIETTGLDPTKDQIISISAVKRNADGTKEHYDAFVKIDQRIPESIVKLTGISNESLKDQGIELSKALHGLKIFVERLPLIGYNLSFDDRFISTGFKTINEEGLSNKLIDLMPIVKKKNKFLDDYKLGTVLEKYKIENSRPHEARSDAEATLSLAEKLIKNEDLHF